MIAAMFELFVKNFSFIKDNASLHNVAKSKLQEFSAPTNRTHMENAFSEDVLTLWLSIFM